MSTPLSLVGRKAQLLGLRAVLGQAVFYAGLPPATPDEAPAGALLGHVLLASPAGVVGDAAGLATLTLDGPQIANATATGVIGFIRFATADGSGVLDVQAGLAAAGLPAVVNALQVYAGGEVQLLSCVIKQ